MTDICDQMVSTDTNLAFSCLLMQIYLGEGLLKIPRVFHFLIVHQTINFGVIGDCSKIISKDKVGATLLRQPFRPVGIQTFIHRVLQILVTFLHRLTVLIHSSILMLQVSPSPQIHLRLHDYLYKEHLQVVVPQSHRSF